MNYERMMDYHRRYAPMKHKHGTAALQAEFWAELDATPTDDCVLWPFNVQPGGYGQCTYNGGSMAAHRASLIRAAGYRRGMVAAHTPGIGCCRQCVNPRHLRWATYAENRQDYRDDKAASNPTRIMPRNCNALTGAVVFPRAHTPAPDTQSYPHYTGVDVFPLAERDELQRLYMTYRAAMLDRWAENMPAA